MQDLLSADFLKFFVPLAGAVLAWFMNERRRRAWEEYLRKEERYRALLRTLSGFYKHAASPKIPRGVPGGVQALLALLQRRSNQGSQRSDGGNGRRNNCANGRTARTGRKTCSGDPLGHVATHIDQQYDARCSRLQGAYIAGHRCGLTRRRTRRATAGFAVCRPRVNSNVRRQKGSRCGSSDLRSVQRMGHDPSSGRLAACCASLQPPLMSNVRRQRRCRVECSRNISLCRPTSTN